MLLLYIRYDLTQHRTLTDRNNKDIQKYTAVTGYAYHDEKQKPTIRRIKQ